MAGKKTYLPPSSILGLAIVALGVLLTLDNLGLIELDNLWAYWPVLLLLVGAARLSAGEVGKALFWLALGTLFLLPNVLEAFEWEMLWDYWPLALIAVGVRVAAGSFASRRHQQAARSATETASDPDEDATETADFAFFSTVRRRIDSKEFRHGELTAILGGCELDLSRAELAPGGAVIEAFAFWGGVQLRIPDHWTVDPQVAVLMGGVEDKTRQRAEPGGRLVIKGFALMGGLEISN